MPYRNREDYKAYQKNYQRKWAKTHPTSVYNTRVRRKNEIREWAEGLKTSCQDCGAPGPKDLGFYPARGVLKVTIPQALSRGWGKARLEEEIALCDVLCTACARKRKEAENP